MIKKIFLYSLTFFMLSILPLYGLSGNYQVEILPDSWSETEIVPPLGVVVFNSKAISHKYIGSPSIVILKKRYISCIS